MWQFESDHHNDLQFVCKLEPISNLEYSQAIAIKDWAFSDGIE